MGASRPPTQVHQGSCYMTGKRHRPIGRHSLLAYTAASDTLFSLLKQPGGRPPGRSRIATSSTRTGGRH
ncbi:hypothetical protein [Streptomyces sp. NPDC056821]|uniref:hypothetical protein n=1 Tax=unclassified Streptomyces TaxID=2593676 RepID=UPI0036B03C35